MDHTERMLGAIHLPRPPAPHLRFSEIGVAFQAVIRDHILPYHYLDRFLHEGAGA